MNYLGVDFHKNYPTETVVDHKGKVLQKEKLYNNKGSFTEFLRLYSEVSAVVEACRNWPVVVDLLEYLVDEVNQMCNKIYL